MPELPEVETVVKGLKEIIIGGQIIDVQTSDKKLRIEYPKNFAHLLKGRSITQITRRSKYIIMSLDDGQQLVFHLGMSGKLLVSNTKQQAQKHDHVMLRLADNKAIIFNDPRRFGIATVIANDEMTTHKLFKHLGIEPLTKEFCAEYLFQLVSGRKTNIKTLIMNANLIVGVGNIYACESLYEAGISPLRVANNITEIEAESLVKQIKSVLKAAIKAGGSTLKDYANSNGDAGYFQHKFSVYGREGKSCKVCDTAIKNTKIAGRSTFYCPQCQK